MPITQQGLQTEVLSSQLTARIGFAQADSVFTLSTLPVSLAFDDQIVVPVRTVSYQQRQLILSIPELTFTNLLSSVAPVNFLTIRTNQAIIYTDYKQTIYVAAGESVLIKPVKINVFIRDS
jgi:hypothetical protein